MIRVCANVSREVADYYKGYNLDDVVNTLLETFEFDNLPQMTGEREIELRVTVQNEMYENLYNLYGPRSKKVSLGRLLEFGYNMNVLKSEKFKIFKVEVPETYPEIIFLRKAIRYLCDARKYDKSEMLQTICESLRLYTVKKTVDRSSVYGSTIDEEAQNAESTD